MGLKQDLEKELTKIDSQIAQKIVDFKAAKILFKSSGKEVAELIENKTHYQKIIKSLPDEITP